MPSELGVEPRSPRYSSFLVLAVFDASCARFRPFLAIFGPFVGHIKELEGKEELLYYSHGAIKVHVKCKQNFPAFGRFEFVFGGHFGPKRAVLGHKMRSFGRAPPDLAPSPRGATGECLARNLHLARAPPKL